MLLEYKKQELQQRRELERTADAQCPIRACLFYIRPVIPRAGIGYLEDGESFAWIPGEAIGRKVPNNAAIRAEIKSSQWCFRSIEYPPVCAGRDRPKGLAREEGGRLGAWVREIPVVSVKLYAVGG